MKCTACGADTPGQAVYCPKCGERLGDAQPSGDPQQAPPADANRQPAGSSPPETVAERVRESLASGQTDSIDDEQNVWEGGYSGKAMLGTWILAALITAILVGGCVYCVSREFLTLGHGLIVLLVLVVLLWGGLGLYLAYRKMSVWYELTTQRFVHKLGVLRRVTDRIEVIDIDDVTFSQGVVQRMVGVGTIHIVSSDRSHPELFLYGIANVREVAEEIDDVRRRERRRRGLHIESI
jgi:hypothetical protein